VREFKAIKNHNGYFISNDGIVRCDSYGPQHRVGFPTLGTDKNGRMWVMLEKKHHYVDHLVLNAFVGNSHNAQRVKHLDGDELNNCLENLVWVKDDGSDLTDDDGLIHPYAPLKQVVYDGVTYSSIKYFCAEVGITESEFWNWFHGNQFIPENLKTKIKGEITLCLI